MSNYPKRFEILQNDGKTLKFRVDELTNGLRDCYIRHLVNGKSQGDANEIAVPITLEYPIE